MPSTWQAIHVFTNFLKTDQWLVKHGHGKLGNRIIMVPLRIIMCFFRPSCKKIQMSANLSRKLLNKFNILEMKAWQVDTL